MAQWNKEIAGFIPGFWKAITWCSLNIIFGLLPLLLLLFLGSMAGDNGETTYLKLKALDSIRECAIMFFCCAIMGSASIDLILSKVRPEKNLTFFGMTAAPLGMLFLVGILYVNALLNHGDYQKINFNLYGVFQIIIILFSIIYCITIKTYVYTKEK